MPILRARTDMHRKGGFRSGDIEPVAGAVTLKRYQCKSIRTSNGYHYSLSRSEGVPARRKAGLQRGGAMLEDDAKGSR
jgi:hypothetical protein